MKHAFALVLALLMLAMSAACSEDPDPTPAPTPAPTPEAAGFASYENQELGVSLMYPEQWASAPSDAPGEWLALVGDDGPSRLTLFTFFNEPDTSLGDRLQQAVETLTLGRFLRRGRASRPGYAR